MQTICKIFKITKIESTAFHPESLGSLERSHHLEYLKHFGNEQNWDTWLHYAIFSYNTSVHEFTEFPPHTLIFGKEANIPSSFERGEKSATYVADTRRSPSEIIRYTIKSSRAAKGRQMEI